MARFSPGNSSARMLLNSSPPCFESLRRSVFARSAGSITCAWSPQPRIQLSKVGRNADPHRQLDRSLPDRSNLLRLVPLPLGDKSRGEGIKPNSHPLRPVGLERRKASRKHFRYREIRRPLKGNLQVPHAFDACQRERAELSTGMVVADQIPLIIDASEMIGRRAPELGLACAKRKIVKLHQLARHYRRRQHFKDLDLAIGNSRRVKGNRLGQLVQGNARLRR